MAVLERKSGARGGHFPLMSRPKRGAQMIFFQEVICWESFKILHPPD